MCPTATHPAIIIALRNVPGHAAAERFGNSNCTLYGRGTSPETCLNPPCSTWRNALWQHRTAWECLVPTSHRHLCLRIAMPLTS